MKKNRNRLLILLALLTIGLTPIPRASYAWNSIAEPPTGGGIQVGTLSGEPDTPNSKSTTTTHTVGQVVPSYPGNAGMVVVPRAMWWSWVIRIWAATHFGVGR
jgi:hypothetical protein